MSATLTAARTTAAALSRAAARSHHGHPRSPQEARTSAEWTSPHPPQLRTFANRPHRDQCAARSPPPIAPRARATPPRHRSYPDDTGRPRAALAFRGGTALRGDRSGDPPSPWVTCSRAFPLGVSSRAGGEPPRPPLALRPPPTRPSPFDSPNDSARAGEAASIPSRGSVTPSRCRCDTDTETGDGVTAWCDHGDSPVCCGASPVRGRTGSTGAP